MRYTKHTHISSKSKLFDLKLKEVWEYKDLIYLFTKRSITVSYKQTILGPLWLIINPLMTSIVYVILFGNIAKLSTEGVPQLLFYFCSQAIWSYFSSCVTTTSNTFVGNANLFGKVYFPRLVVPISNVLMSLFKFIIQFCLLIVFIIYYGISASYVCWIGIPIILIILGLLGMGFGIVISSLTTKYRDLSVLVTFGMSLWMYATPIVYPLSSIHGTLRTIILCNPVSSLVEGFRYLMLGVGTISVIGIAYSLVCALIIVLVGILVFNHIERTFMDTV